METETSWLDSVLGKLGKGVDYVLDEWVTEWSGMSDSEPLVGLGGNPYPESTAPTIPNPTVQAQGSFKLGNNAPTWAIGAGVLLLSFIAYKAVK